jgi:hypothetical protein
LYKGDYKLLKNLPPLGDGELRLDMPDLYQQMITSNRLRSIRLS